ncbi:5552_t:CDS:2, partial [Funneliformis mosseae]
VPDLNPASRAQLQIIDQIGERKADMILEERNKRKFKDLSDAEKRLPSMKKQLTHFKVSSSYRLSSLKKITPETASRSLGLRWGASTNDCRCYHSSITEPSLSLLASSYVEYVCFMIHNSISDFLFPHTVL